MACINRKKYAGPLPDTAVTASICASSSSHRAMPTADSSCPACSRCAALTCALAYSPLAPWRSSAGVLGMQRTTGRGWPSQASRLAQGMPAAMETISCSGFSAGAKAWHTAFMACGLTDRTTTSASATASALDSTTSMANSPAIFARCSAPGSLARICAAGTP